MLTSNIALAWQFHRQERQQSHLTFLRWTQAILMIIIVTLTQTSQSIQDYLSENLNNLLGADLVLSQHQALTDEQRISLYSMVDRSVVTNTAKTTLTHQKKWQRVTLKGVGNGYPLQGELLSAPSLVGSAEPATTGPEIGQIWFDTRLLASLSLKINDAITIANVDFRISSVLLHEPDRLMEGHNVDMRAMVHIDDFAKLNLPPETIQYRTLATATKSQIDDVIAWQKEQLPAAQIYHKQGDHPLSLFWQRTENFIGLASIILFFMAAIAIEQLTHVQMRKEQYFTAVCMSLGASKTAGLQISILKWLIQLSFVVPFVLIASAFFHGIIVYWLGQTFANIAVQWNVKLAIQSVLAICGVLAVFQFPVWAALLRSSIAQLVSNKPQRLSYWLTSACAIVVLSLVALAYTDNVLLTLIVLTAMTISIALLLLMSWIALTLGEKLTQRVSGLVPFALFMMKQRLMSKSTQILGVGLCAFLLLFTLMLMKDLGSTMAKYQRQHDGNLLVSQATYQQMNDIDEFANIHEIEIRQRKPYVRAKLTKINGEYLSDVNQQPSESMATLQRAIRLHWTDTVPQNNVIEQGQWWSSTDQDWQKVSVEQEVMTDLSLKIGDSLTFYIGTQSVDFIISASHAYKSGAGSITFWVQMPTAALAHIDATHYRMASLELEDHQFALLHHLWQKHPTLRMVSLDEITARFDTILNLITRVISGFSIIISCLAFIVIVSSTHAIESKEKKKNSLIMSFGFNKTTCLKLNIIEWLVTGLIAGCGAIGGTYFAGLLIYQSQFSIIYTPNSFWLVGTLSIILLIVTSIGIYASKNSLSSSVRELMAEH